ncbi:PREDICTED: heat stress transcription factor C-1 [Camelina sativa]|uniref:Heat stress transcription factor C-1 n=1 Tax=Camelina sativa TaxID=90675 RepID=A0ABM0Z8F8_CAMSA|nr:PREDICTED: heat stress transcription factor C-1 [Camelina sativa]
MDGGDSNGDPITLGSFFRSQLYEMVDDPSTDSIVSWSESGKSFVVWDDSGFLKAESLELWGFRKVEESDQKWEYACDYFVRGQPGLKPPPHICGGPVLTPGYRRKIEIVFAGRKGLDINNGLIPLSSLSCMKGIYAAANKQRSVRKQRRPSLFKRKMYDMVDDPSTDSIVSWSESGKSFIIWKETEFLRDVLPQHVFFLRYEMTSFARWLYVMGYRKVEESSHQWEFAGDYLVRGEPGEPDLPTPPCTPGGIMVTPETARIMETNFAFQKKYLEHQACNNE